MEKTQDSLRLHWPLIRAEDLVVLNGGAWTRERGLHCGAEGYPFVVRTKRHHGSENVFTVVMHFMASMTPSLMPRPLSLMPPKGELSMR